MNAGVTEKKKNLRLIQSCKLFKGQRICYCSCTDKVKKKKNCNSQSAMFKIYFQAVCNRIRIPYLATLPT